MDNFERYQVFRLAIGSLFGLLWCHYLLVYVLDKEAFNDNLIRLRFKIFLIWFWNLLDIFLRFIIYKIPQKDIIVHHLIILFTLFFSWYLGYIIDIVLLYLFHEIYAVYDSLFRMHRYYRKEISFAIKNILVMDLDRVNMKCIPKNL